MSNDSSDLPVFSTSAPAVFRDRAAASALFTDTLGRLAAVVDVDEEHLTRATPCAGFTVGELRKHALGWLGFFAAALADHAATSPRPDPDAFQLEDRGPASDDVRRALDQIRRAIDENAAEQMVTMQSSRMAGDGVLAMALGEYLIHAWDIATATGQPYEAPAAAVGPAHEFLRSMVAPEYRGPDTGFFDHEVAVEADAGPFAQLLGFAGRDPQWTPPTTA